MDEIIIGKKYKILNQIGEGSFGKIFEAEHILTGDHVAIKIEKLNKKSLLKHEANIYYKCKNTKGIPNIKIFGTEENYNYIIMDLLGISLDKLREIQFGILSLIDTLHIGMQLIQILENLHNKGIIHRDIKPENILMENKSISKLCLIDFGLSRYYIDQERMHIPIQYGKKFIGNVRFASLNIHNGLEPSRRDDLISLGYIFIICLKGSLPWQKICSDSKEERNSIIKNVKETTSLIELCCDIPYEFLSYMSYCYSLKFEEEPDYNYIKNLFSNLYNMKTKI
jgi:serine/threonine protein kinase